MTYSIKLFYKTKQKTFENFDFIQQNKFQEQSRLNNNNSQNKLALKIEQQDEVRASLCDYLRARTKKKE